MQVHTRVPTTPTQSHTRRSPLALQNSHLHARGRMVTSPDPPENGHVPGPAGRWSRPRTRRRMVTTPDPPENGHVPLSQVADYNFHKAVRQAKAAVPAPSAGLALGRCLQSTHTHTHTHTHTPTATQKKPGYHHPPITRAGPPSPTHSAPATHTLTHPPHLSPASPHLASPRAAYLSAPHRPADPPPPPAAPTPTPVLGRRSPRRPGAVQPSGLGNGGDSEWGRRTGLVGAAREGPLFQLAFPIPTARPCPAPGRAGAARAGSRRNGRERRGGEGRGVEG